MVTKQQNTNGSTLEILALATATPGYSISQKEAAAFACNYADGKTSRKRVLEHLYARTEIDRRHAVVAEKFYPLPDDSQSRGPSTETRMKKYASEIAPLAVQAAGAALEQCGGEADDFTHLITVSCTGFYAPGFDIALIKQLNLPADISRFHLGFMGCHGAVNGLKLALGLATSSPPTKILLCAAELCSIHYQYGSNSSDILANSLFADGAAALVLKPGSAGRHSQDSGSFPNGGTSGAALANVVASSSYLVADSSDAMTWNIGDNGFEMTLSSQVSQLISENLSAWMDSWLSRFGLQVTDINSWAVHPGGPRILDAVQESLALDQSSLAASRQVLSEYGNMSSPTVLFILDKLRRSKASGPCVMLGFGPGLVIEAALLI